MALLGIQCLNPDCLETTPEEMLTTDPPRLTCPRCGYTAEAVHDGSYAGPDRDEPEYPEERP